MKELLDRFGFSIGAAGFLLTLWDLIQFFDDVKDMDTIITDETIYDAVTKALVQLPLNPFYGQHAPCLASQVLLAIEKWRLANTMESTRSGDARSFMWRAAFYDILALVCVIEGKPVRDALLSYGEKYEDYLQEVNHA